MKLLKTILVLITLLFASTGAQAYTSYANIQVFMTNWQHNGWLRLKCDFTYLPADYVNFDQMEWECKFEESVLGVLMPIFDYYGNHVTHTTGHAWTGYGVDYCCASGSYLLTAQNHMRYRNGVWTYPWIKFDVGWNGDVGC